MVMRLPSRSRCTSLPSLTARRPKVVSATSAWRQYSEIRLRIWSFFIGQRFGKRRWAAADGAPVLTSFAHYWEMAAFALPSQERCFARWQDFNPTCAPKSSPIPERKRAACRICHCAGERSISPRSEQRTTYGGRAFRKRAKHSEFFAHLDRFVDLMRNLANPERTKWRSNGTDCQGTCRPPSKEWEAQYRSNDRIVAV